MYTAGFLIFDLDTIFNTEFVGMYMLYPHTKFLMPNCSCSVVITIKPKARVRAATILLPCILHECTNANVHTRMQVCTHRHKLVFSDLLPFPMWKRVRIPPS
jgi:hypothetical protein